MMRPLRIVAATIGAVAAGALLAPAALATAGGAGAPQWQLSIVPAPDSFVPSVDHVDSVLVKGTGGTFELGLPGSERAEIECGATAQKVQEKLDALSEIKQEVEVDGGHGEVSVSGAPTCSEANSTPYVITFTGGLGGEALPSLEDVATGLTGTTRSVEVSTASEGAPIGGDQYVLTATNVGGAASSGQVQLEDVLPAGVSLRSDAYPDVRLSGGVTRHAGESFEGGPLACSAPPASTVTCTYSRPVAPGDMLIAVLRVSVPGALNGEQLLDAATLSEGGVVRVREEATTPVGEASGLFGLGAFALHTSTVQAGAHPNLTTSLTVEQSHAFAPAGTIKDLQLSLPPGLIGDVRALPQCNVYVLKASGCPENTAVGVATAHLAACLSKGDVTDVSGPRCMTNYPALVYNIKPYPGEPAAFAFRFIGQYTVRIDTSLVRDSAGEYAVHVAAEDINGAQQALDATVTLWGVPAAYNGAGPDFAEGAFGSPGQDAAIAEPFLTNPSQCQKPVGTLAEADSYQEGGRWSLASSPLLPPSIESAEGRLQGCALLAPLFTPSLEAAPTTTQAGAPTGLEVHLKVPQHETPEAPATPDLREASVTLPQGMVASPSFANGLEACSDHQFEEASSAPAKCPLASEIGEVEVATPLLPTPLKGQVFLGQPECSPCSSAQAGAGEMVRLLLQMQYENGQYIRIKLSGHTTIDQQTGQLTTTFDEDPQAPFEVLRLKLFGGQDAPLVNPATCGPASTTSKLTPWSSTPAEPFSAEPSSGYTVTGCTSPRFAPTLNAGMTGSSRGGGYSPLLVQLQRGDQDREFTGLTVHMPPGLAGMVSHVSQCPEAQANEGACPASSEIGSVSAAVGPGSDPYWITGGKAFLTGPYKGEPFGLSIVVPAVAGPFVLAGKNGSGQEGHGTVVVRASIAVNPVTAAITVTSDEIPTQLDGIPLQVKTIDVDANRPEFTFNATNCEAMSIAATVTGTSAASAAVSSPYQATNCATLPFDPGFKVYTHAHHTRKGGAYLHVVVTSSQDQANIGKVHVSLPIALPSRLDTLKQACNEAQFASNPAGCPEGAFVGVAVAHTPVLQKELTGPAIFVSHGGRGFPDLDIVLQGEGVTVDLTGNTFITKGITTSTFKTVPDVPVSRFDLTLPEGPHSALAGTGNFCTRSVIKKKRIKLRRDGHVVRHKGHVVYKVKKVKHRVVRKMGMSTVITGQNGAVVERKIKIAIEGCQIAKSKKTRKATRDIGKKHA